MMKEISDIATNPMLTETQKMLDTYNEMLKPLQMESVKREKYIFQIWYTSIVYGWLL